MVHDARNIDMLFQPFPYGRSAEYNARIEYFFQEDTGQNSRSDQPSIIGVRETAGSFEGIGPGSGRYNFRKVLR